MRDLPLLREAASVTHVGLSLSVGFVDDALWRSVEPGTPHPRRRLAAVRTLVDAGFDVAVLMAPILPGLTDTDEAIEATVKAIADAGAASVTPCRCTFVRAPGKWYAAWLRRSFPSLLAHYRELFRAGSYLPDHYQRELTARVREVANRHGLPRATPSRSRPLPPPSGPSAPVAEQLALL